MDAPGTGTSEGGWKERLRKSLDDDLIGLRYCARGSEVDFLLIHTKGRRHEAIARFLDALPTADALEFDFRTIEAGSGEDGSYAELRDYVSV